MLVIREGKATGRILAGLLEEIETVDEAIAICEKLRKRYAKAGIKLGELYIMKVEEEIA